MKNLLIFFAFPLLALDNSVRINDASGSTQTGQPRTIHRYFAQGEFPSGTYPKPRVAGSVPATWQVDVESTYPDGSVMAAFISLPVTISANSSVVVDFVADSNPCHLGNLATCQAAALDQSGMLAFNSSTWDAVLTGTANSISYNANARTMLTAGAWTYRLRGPVVTQVVVEDLTRPNPVYDFGWQYNGSAWIAPSTDNYKSIHPLFVLSFYAGWAGVEVELMAVQGATTRLQRQVFDLAVTKNGGALVYSKSSFDLPRSSAFTRYFWDGTAPAAVQIDFNLKYMIYSRILPPFDHTTPRMGGNDLSSYDTGLAGGDPQECLASNGLCANWKVDITGVGGRGDIGLIPRWYVTYLFAMGDTGQFSLATRVNLFNKGVIGNADAAQTIPFHYLEYDNSAVRDSSADGQRYYFDAAQTTPAFGRVPSTWARPEWLSGDREALDGADKMTPVCTTGPCEGNRPPNPAVTKNWIVDPSHMPSAFFIPYVLTGRYSYLRAQFEMSAYMVARPSYDCYNGGNLRCADWGIQALWGNHRGSAWVLREAALAAIVAPTGSPEKSYFTRIVEKNDEQWEGRHAIYGGNAQATTDVNYCRGADLGNASTSQNLEYYTDVMGTGSLFKFNDVARWIVVPSPMYSVTSFTINGVSKTVGVAGVDTGRDWYYTPGNVALYQDEAAPTFPSTSTIAVSYHKTALVSPWCSGRYIYFKGQPNGIGNFVWNDSKSYGSYMSYYIAWTNKWIEDTGALLHSVTGQPLFKYANQGTARHLIGWATNSAANPHYADFSASYNMDLHNTLPNTWTELMAIQRKSSTLVADITNSATSFAVYDSHVGWPYQLHEFFTPSIVKIDNEWISLCSWSENSPTNQSTMTVCTGGRGMFGTTAAAHSAGAVFDATRQSFREDGYGHAYAALYTSAVAMYEEYNLPSGTGRRAWERMMGDIRNVSLRQNAPEYNFVPRDRIQNLRATPGTGTLALAWTAPSGAACVVGLNPTSSDDSTDSAATAKGRAQSYNATGLSAGSNTYRITCGTARTTGAATIQ